MTMRVLYVIDSLIGGGAEHSLAHMAPGYRDLGLELHVAFLKSRWDVAAALRDAGAVLHPVELDRGRARQLVALVRLIRRLDPDVVHTTLWEADVIGRTAAAIARVPSVTTFANSSFGQAKLANPAVNATKLRAAQLVDVATARLARRYHAVSEPVKQDMARRLRVDPDRIDVVPRARRRDVLGEPSVARRDTVRSALGIDQHQPVVLAIARHEHQKGLDVLVDAAVRLRAELADVAVLVAGRPGRDTAALEASIARHAAGRTVRLLGARTDVADLIVAADVVAVPSRVEGLPGAVLEAMALETPVVASDLPMVRAAIGDHAAAFVPVDDAAALAGALANVLQHPEGARRASAAARARFDARFSPDAVVADLAEVYRRATAPRRRRTSAT
jgi:glycosyltransferase involved in cell wall biosynthesis